MPLTLYPAIDLKDGQCVRLKRGEMDQVTVYSSDPGAQARAWQDAGFAWLHVVDLNGAFAGRSANGDSVRAILSAVAMPVQLGGGIRDLAGVEAWLSAGISRVILGSAAAKNPPLVLEACRAFPGRVAASLLGAIGMPELIAGSQDVYEALAIRLANDKDAIDGLKRKLAQDRLHCPLYDTDRFTKNLEAAYATMWATWKKGEPPTGFAV